MQTAATVQYPRITRSDGLPIQSSDSPPERFAATESAVRGPVISRSERVRPPCGCSSPVSIESVFTAWSSLMALILQL